MTIDLAQMFQAMMLAAQTPLQRAQAAVEDVKSAIAAMPADEKLDEILKDPTNFRLKLEVDGGHLEAFIPSDRAEELVVMMHESLAATLKQREAELAMAEKAEAEAVEQ